MRSKDQLEFIKWSPYGENVTHSTPCRLVVAAEHAEPSAGSPRNSATGLREPGYLTCCVVPWLRATKWPESLWRRRISHPRRMMAMKNEGAVQFFKSFKFAGGDGTCGWRQPPAYANQSGVSVDQPANGCERKDQARRSETGCSNLARGVPHTDDLCFETWRLIQRGWFNQRP